MEGCEGGAGAVRTKTPFFQQEPASLAYQEGREVGFPEALRPGQLAGSWVRAVITASGQAGRSLVVFPSNARDTWS